MRSSTGDGPRHQWCEHELHCPPVSDAAMPGPSHLGGHIPASLLLPTALSLSLTRGITDFGLSRERLMQLAPCRRCRTPTKCRGRAAGDERRCGRGPREPEGPGPHGVTGRLRASPPTRRPTPVRDQAAGEADDLAGHSRPLAARLVVQRRGPAARHSWSPVATRQVHSRPPAPKPAAGAAVPMCGPETRQTSPAALRRRPAPAAALHLLLRCSLRLSMY